MSTPVSHTENQKTFSHLYYPCTVIPIERLGTWQRLEIIWTERLLSDSELEGSPYRLRAWSPEDGASFAYAMARNPREDIDYSVLIYNPEAYERTFVGIPTFHIFDLHYPSDDEFPETLDAMDVDARSDDLNEDREDYVYVGEQVTPLPPSCPPINYVSSYDDGSDDCHDSFTLEGYPLWHTRELEGENYLTSF